MADMISFSLRNNQMTDVNVTVIDARNGTTPVANQPLNRGESTQVSLIADSDGRGAAQWLFASGDGSVNSNNSASGIADGSEFTLG